MIDGLASIITSLEQQKVAIDKALSAFARSGRSDDGTSFRNPRGRKERNGGAAVRQKMAAKRSGFDMRTQAESRTRTGEEKAGAD